MKSLYSLIPEEKLHRKLESLSICLNLPVRLLDENGLQLIKFKDTYHYCALLRQYFPEGECAEIHHNAGKLAYSLGESYIFSCHAELNHIAFSLVSHKRLLGTVIIGPFLMDAPDSTFISTLAEKYSISRLCCLELYEQIQLLPVITPEKANAISRLTNDIFAPLLSDERLLMQEKQGKLYQQSRINETVQLFKGANPVSAGAFIYEKEKELLAKVRRRDMESAKALLNELLGFVLLAEGTDLSLIRTRAFELTVLLSFVAMDNGAPPERIFNMTQRYLDTLQQTVLFEDICYILQEIVENFVDVISVPESAGSNTAVRRAVEYIAQHYDQPISIQQVAEMLKLSPSYFSSLFSRKMGMGFHAYLTRVRIEEATRLLTATDYPISQIASFVGYADQSSFTKAFSRLMGITPHQIR